MRDRALKLLHEYGWDLFILLILAAAALLAERAFHSTRDLPARLVRAKDLVEILSTVIGTVLLLLGAMVGYRKYLKGRAFAERLRLTLRGGPVRWIVVRGPAGDGPALVHAIDLEVENVGAKTLWSPVLAVRVLSLDEDRGVALDVHMAEFIAPRPTASLEGIQPGETMVFHASFKVPASVEVFRVVAELRASGNAWLRALTLANAFEPDKERPHAQGAESR